MNIQANSRGHAAPPSTSRSKRRWLRVSRPLTASPDRVWRLISAGNQVERWFEWVAETLVSDPAEGGMRVIRMKDGSTFDEYITLNDAHTRTYQYYAPQPPLALEHVIGTKRIESAPDGTHRLTWSVTFELSAGAHDDFTRTMRDLYEAALAKIDECARVGRE